MGGGGGAGGGGRGPAAEEGHSRSRDKKEKNVIKCVLYLILCSRTYVRLQTGFEYIACYDNTVVSTFSSYTVFRFV